MAVTVEMASKGARRDTMSVRLARGMGVAGPLRSERIIACRRVRFSDQSRKT